MNQVAKRLIIVCLLINIISCKEQIQSNNEMKTTNNSETIKVKPETNNEILSDKMLQETEWSNHPYRGHGTNINFLKDSEYQIHSVGGGCNYLWKGKYHIINKKTLTLKKGILQFKDCETDDEPERNCEYKKEKNPILFEYYLDCGKEQMYIYWNQNTAIPSNSNIIFQNVSVLALGGKKGVTTDDAKLREKPDINSKSFNCISEATMEKKPYVLNKEKLILLFKTLEKQKVKKWENYWYYVYVDSGWYGRCDSENNLGWIFGEFVREDNKY